MLFNSLTFLVFFIVVFALHRAVRGWPAKKLVLLIASYLFYAAWNPPYVLILLFSTTLDWWLARRIDRSIDDRRRRALLVVSLVANLGLLGFFKYGDFLLINAREALAWIGVAYVPPQWSVVLPIGISFYTFASLSYTIDVYRRQIHAETSFLDYALFVSFFPHLVAGPIVRAHILLPQIEAPRFATRAQVGWGLALLVLGLTCKVIFADNVFAPVVDAVYKYPAAYGIADTWAAVLSFSGQIYYDFGGYSLCAIGLALCFGFSFPDNFRYPYAARGFADFWRRWHITLSSWLRDYLYIPLGGNRHGPMRTYRNLILTMLLGGLWHGASWMFVLWGGLHGVYLAIERGVRGSSGDRGDLRAMPLLTLLTFLVVTLTWIPFRAGDTEVARLIFGGLWRSPAVIELNRLPMYASLLAIAATFAWHCWMRDRSLEAVAAKLGNVGRVLVLSACLIALYLYSGGDERAFIYFQF
jgi:D-alanyl-lipoteichoic acid acyltransferase DltB (MBOAT superfamily)